MQEDIKEWINETRDLRERILTNENGVLDQIEEGARLVLDTLRQGNKILLCGNGGSAADAQHIAAELIVRYKGSNEREAVPAIALSTDTSVLTACSNDYSFDEVFARQVSALGQEGDLLIGFSTSGNSPNVIRALEVADKKNLSVLKMLGGSGGKLSSMTGTNVTIPSSVTARIQEMHITVGHIFCEFIDKKLFGY